MQRDKFIDQVNYYRSKKDKELDKETSDTEQTTRPKELIIRPKKWKRKKKKNNSKKYNKYLAFGRNKEQIRKIEMEKII